LAVYLVGQNPHLGVHEAAGGFVARGFNPEGYHGTKITYGAARPNPTLHKPPELGENESNMSSSLFGKDDLLKTFQPLSESGKAYLEIQLINPKSGKAEGRGFFNDADFLLEACRSMVGRYNFSLSNFAFNQAQIPTRGSYNQFDRALSESPTQDQARAHSLSLLLLLTPDP